MLTSSDVINLLPSGEGYNIEFKLALPAKLKEITEEVCAFANAAGGIILIGVNDKNQIAGTSIDNSKRSALQDAFKAISPELNLQLYKLTIERKDLWIIEVPSGPQKPYTLSGAIYVRQGPNTQKITAVEQMRDFFQQANRIYFDENPCSGFDPFKDIDHNYFDNFRILARLSTTISNDQVFNNLKLMHPDGRMKNGAVLFFGSHPEHFIEKAVIRCVAFDGLDKTYIIDDKIFTGPLMIQYHQATQWLKSKLSVKYIIEGAGPRKEIWEIPESVLKEAIINALTHRDYYDKGGRTTIELFNNRLEIRNPGGLVSAIKPKDFGTISHSRNPLIFGLFERIDMVEQIGSGISRIRTEMDAAQLPPPIFITEGTFAVILHRQISTHEETPEKNTPVNKPETKEISRVKTRAKTRVKTRAKTKKLIIEVISQNAMITIPELAETLGISDKGIEYHIANLKKEGLLDREGPTHGGKWIVIANIDSLH